MRSVLLYLLLAAILAATVAIIHLRASTAEANAALLEAEALQLRVEVARWQTAYAQAKAGQDALAAQAQACLDRASAARADAEEWRQILQDMTLRAMSEEETKGVPDDATRRALLADLDRPL